MFLEMYDRMITWSNHVYKK